MQFSRSSHIALIATVGKRVTCNKDNPLWHSTLSAPPNGQIGTLYRNHRYCGTTYDFTLAQMPEKIAEFQFA
eukprot:2681954-Amphidinium_carterae.2